jgi:prepilin-type N-terminal cleavage/methylation domain-containing protein
MVGGDTTKTMATGGNQQQGFTIVETLIVLAVSAALLLVGMLFVSGRQNKTEFLVAINGEKQQMEQLINETANGFYPHSQDFIRDIDSFTEAKPVALGTSSGVDLSTASQLNNGLSFVKATYTPKGGAAVTYTHLGLVVLAFDLGQYSPSGGNLNSAAQRLDLFTYPASVLNVGSYQTNAQLTSRMNGSLPQTSPALSSVDLCFASGGTNQSGKVTISGLGNLGVSLTIYSGKTCS